MLVAEGRNALLPVEEGRGGITMRVNSELTQAGGVTCLCLGSAACWQGENCPLGMSNSKQAKTQRRIVRICSTCDE